MTVMTPRFIRRLLTAPKRSGVAGRSRKPKSLLATLLVGFLVLAPPGTLIVGALAVAGFVGALFNHNAPDAEQRATSADGVPSPAATAAATATPAPRAEEGSRTCERTNPEGSAPAPRKPRPARAPRRAHAAAKRSLF